MLSMKLLSLASRAGVGLLIASAAPAQQAALKYNPPIGEVFHYRTHTVQDMDMDLGPMGSQKMTSDIEMKMTQVAHEQAGDETRVESTIQAMIMDIKQGGASIMSWDSRARDAENDQELGEMAAMLGQTFEVVVSERGEIRSVSGLDAMWDALGQSDDPAMKQQMEMMKGGLGDEAMIAMMQGGMPVFPEGPLAVGDSWSWDAVTPNPILGELSLATTYTVGEDSVHNGTPCLELVVAVDMSVEGESPMLSQLAASFGGEMSLDMDVEEAAGTVCISRETGMVLTSSMRQLMNVGVAMTGPDGEDMTLKIAINQTVVTELES